MALPYVRQTCVADEVHRIEALTADNSQQEERWYVGLEEDIIEE